MKWIKKEKPNKNMTARCVCRDCKYWMGSEFSKDGVCVHLPAFGRTIAEGFCYWAEKRKGE
jgi:hypothetical protein